MKFSQMNNKDKFTIQKWILVLQGNSEDLVLEDSNMIQTAFKTKELDQDPERQIQIITTKISGEISMPRIHMRKRCLTNSISFSVLIKRVDRKGKMMKLEAKTLRQKWTLTLWL